MSIRRLLQLIALWTACAVVTMAYGLMSGCLYRAEPSPPDLAKTPWIDFKVTYCVGYGPVVTMKELHSRDFVP